MKLKIDLPDSILQHPLFKGSGLELRLMGSKDSWEAYSWLEQYVNQMKQCPDLQPLESSLLALIKAEVEAAFN